MRWRRPQERTDRGQRQTAWFTLSASSPGPLTVQCRLALVTLQGKGKEASACTKCIPLSTGNAPKRESVVRVAQQLLACTK
eukprot:12936185-Prorocentrum_lima.AAC.1